MLTKKRILLLCLMLFFILLLAFIYYYREKLLNIFAPLFIAVIIAYILRPLVARLEKKNIPRRTGIILIYLTFLVILTAIIIFIIPELINNTKDLMTTLPDLSSKYERGFNFTMEFIKSSNWPDDFKFAIFKQIASNSSKIEIFIEETLRKMVGHLINTIVILFDIAISMIIAYYLIKDGKFFKSSVLQLIPVKWQNAVVKTGREVNDIIGNFIQGQLLTALIIGIIESILLFFLQVKYPIFLGVFGGLANVIPYFGPIIGAIPAIAIALLDSPIKALWVAIMFIIVQQIDNIFLSPRIVESKLGLHPVTTIIAVLAGEQFFGIIGIIIAVPMAAIIKIIFKRLLEVIV
jgi:predicted PurR-regulated permease PerM